MRLATPRHWENYFSALRFAALLGAGFGIVAGAVMLKPPRPGAFFGCISAVVDFTTAMALIGAMEIFLPRTRLGPQVLAFVASSQAAAQSHAQIDTALARRRSTRHPSLIIHSLLHRPIKRLP